MKIQSEELYKALKKLKINKVSKLPILNYVYMNVENNIITMFTTDLEKVNKAIIPCITKEEEKWSACLPMVLIYNPKPMGKYYSNKKYKGYPFMDFVKICSEDSDILEFVFNKLIETVTIVGENYKTNLKCPSSDEFPVGLCEEKGE